MDLPCRHHITPIVCSIFPFSPPRVRSIQIKDPPSIGTQAVAGDQHQQIRRSQTTLLSETNTLPIQQTMSEGWINWARLQDHRLHRSQRDADECPFHPDRKHFSYLPPCPEESRNLRGRRSLVSMIGAHAGSKGWEDSGEDQEVDEEYVQDDESLDSADDASSVLSSTCSSVVASPLSGSFSFSGSESLPRHNTPGRAAPTAAEAGYPTPISQQVQRKARKPLSTYSRAATPTPAHVVEVDVHMARTRRRSLINNAAASLVSHSIISETTLAPPDADGALPGPPHRSIEAGSHSPLVIVPATATPPPRSNTPELRALRRRHSDLVEELRDQTFTSARLQTRNRIHVANLTIRQRELHDAQAELKFAHDQLEAAQTEAGRKREDAVTARRICGWSVAGFAVMVVAYVVWCWINGVEYEYIAKRLREFYGLEK